MCAAEHAGLGGEGFITQRHLQLITEVFSVIFLSPFCRRPLRGRSGRGDPRLVRSLDLEVLEEEADHTRRLLEEERAKNKYLTTLVEDLKR